MTSNGTETNVQYKVGYSYFNNYEDAFAELLSERQRTSSVTDIEFIQVDRQGNRGITLAKGALPLLGGWLAHLKASNRAGLTRPSVYLKKIKK